MKKRIVFLIISVVVIIFTTSFSLLIFERNKMNYSIKKLPNIKILTTDGLTYNTSRFLQNNLPLLVFYFHPECDFCSAEIEELLKHKNEFEDIDMLFITFASISEIKEFMQAYPLNEFKHVVIGMDYTGEFVSTFHIESSPMIYIYDQTKKLRKKFKSLVSYQQIRKFIIKN
jgi:peroxiredoxin